MKLLLSFIITLWTFSVFGGAIDYRSLRQDQFTTNIPSPGYVGILGSGVTNISATNVNISAGGSIIFTTNGANISISTTGTGQATNVAIIAGTNIVIQTNGAGTWTINGSLNTNIVNSLVTNGILNNPQFTTNVVTTNAPAGVTNFVNSQITNQTTTAAFTNQIQSIATNVANNSFSNQVPSFIHGRTNYLALFNPNTNEVSASIMFQTNGTTDVAIRNGDSPDGSAAISFKVFGKYATENGREWLDSKWSVANGDYEIMSDHGSTGTLRPLTFGIAGQRLWTIISGGHIEPVVNNVYDIGQSSAAIRNIHIGSASIFDNTGVAGVSQIGTAASPGSGINFQGPRIGFVDAFNSVDVVRIETETVTPPSRSIVDIGATILAAGSAAGSRNSWLGQDQLHTGNRWMFGTNNTAAGAPSSNSIIASAGNGNNIPGGDLIISGGPSTGSGSSGTLYFGSGGSGAATTVLNTITNRMEIAPVTGTVTIYSNLVVNGTITGTVSGGQTPWTSDINGANFSLTNVSSVLTTNLQVSGSGANFVNALNVSSNLYLTNLTASRIVISDANKGLISAVASGAVPVDADGSATTFAQVNTLAPGFVVTNGESQAFTASNNVSVDYTHQFNGNGIGITNAALFSLYCGPSTYTMSANVRYVALGGGNPGSGTLTNVAARCGLPTTFTGIYLDIPVPVASTTNVAVYLMTNGVASNIGCTLLGPGSNTNVTGLTCFVAANTVVNLGISNSAATAGTIGFMDVTLTGYR